MSLRIIVVDDDISICKMINNIITQYKLGQVIAECNDGLEAEWEIREGQPDIALIDLLLPGQDGIELVRKLRSTCPNTAFIMISQVSNQPMITRAYESGIEFFIHKPLNALELVSVINKVHETLKLKQLMSAICKTTAQYAAPLSTVQETAETTLKERIYKCFSDLGIIGEAGSKDIYLMTKLIDAGGDKVEPDSYQLGELSQKLAQKINQDSKTVEQRVRRTITKALKNIASLGLEDANHDKFQIYSTTLFDFREVRQTMDFINGKSNYSGKINVKKFIEGLLFIAKANQSAKAKSVMNEG